VRVQFEVFKSSTKSWKVLAEEASQYASNIGRERLINITVSADGGQGVIMVWYWG
jgi:hypothetical protein